MKAGLISKDVDLQPSTGRNITNYNIWNKFAKGKNLKPVFDNFYEFANPWYYTAYASSKKERDYWLNWGWKNKLYLTTYPRLPLEVEKENGDASKRWERLICFPIDLLDLNTRLKFL